MQLLVMSPLEMKQRVSAFQWKQYMTSGLSKGEVRAIAHQHVEKVPSLEQQSSPSQPCYLPRYSRLWAALHSPQEPLSRLAPFQGSYHSLEAGPKFHPN